MLRVAFLGAGGVGSALAAQLYHGGAHVSLLTRGEHLQELQERGLAVRNYSPAGAQLETWQLRPDALHASDDPAEVLARSALAIVTTKPQDAATVVVQCHGWLTGRRVPIVALQNGLRSHDEIRAVLPDGHPYLVGTYAGESYVIEPGVVRKVGDPRVVIGPYEGQLAPGHSSIAAHLRAAGLDCSATHSGIEAAWRRAAFLIPMVSMTAALGCTIGDVRRDSVNRDRLFGLIEEVASLAAAMTWQSQKIDPVHLAQRAGFTIDRIRKAATGTLGRDVQRGRRGELDYLTGWVVESGRKLGVDVALHEQCMTAIEQRLAVAVR